MGVISVQNYVVHSNHNWSGSPGAPESGQVFFSSTKNSVSPLQDMLHAGIPRAILLQGHAVTIQTLHETHSSQLQLLLTMLTLKRSKLRIEARNLALILGRPDVILQHRLHPERTRLARERQSKARHCRSDRNGEGLGGTDLKHYKQS